MLVVYSAYFATSYLVDIYHIFDSCGSLHWKGVMKCALEWINWLEVMILVFNVIILLKEVLRTLMSLRVDP